MENTARTKRDRRTLSLEDKVKILERVKVHCGTQVALAKRLGIPVSTLHTIMKNKDSILQFVNNCGPNYKKMKYASSSKYAKLEAITKNWFEAARASNIVVNGVMLREKALKVAKMLGIKDFSASNGWIDRFKKRHNVVYKTICGEANSERGHPSKILQCDSGGDSIISGVVHKMQLDSPGVVEKEETIVNKHVGCYPVSEVDAGRQRKRGRPRKVHQCDNDEATKNMGGVVQQIQKKRGRPRKVHQCDNDEATKNMGGVVQQIQKEVEHKAVEEEPVEDLVESTCSAVSQEVEYKAVEEEPVEGLVESTCSAVSQKRWRPRKICQCDDSGDNKNTGCGYVNNMGGVVHKMLKKRGRPRKIPQCDYGGDNIISGVVHKVPKKRGRPRKIHRCDDGGDMKNIGGVVHQILKKRGRPRKIHRCDDGDMKNIGGVVHQVLKKRGRPRKIRQCDDSGDNKNMDGGYVNNMAGVVHKILKKRGRPRKIPRCDSGGNNIISVVVHNVHKDWLDIVIKEEKIVDGEVGCYPDGEGDAGRQRETEYISVEEEPVEDLNESTCTSMWQSREQMGHVQEEPFIKEEIDSDDYIDPLGIPEEGYWQ